MKTAKRIITLILCLTFMITIGGDIFSAFSVTASAAETVEYSNVLDDLKKDSSFNPDDYPAKADDYSLQVIQIAEGANGELFVYVYQPSALNKVITATEIRIGQPEVGIDTTWHDYTLSLVSIDGVFFKYLVVGIELKENSTRYYDIPCIYRLFDSTIGDVEADYDNTVNAVDCEVAQQWEVKTEGDIVTYRQYATETVRITKKWCGFIEYPGGFSLSPSWCNSHFVAFKTDREIDKLYEADVVFYLQPYSQTFVNGSLGDPKVNGDPERKEVTVSHTTKVSFDGLLWSKYSWDRIQSDSMFWSSEDENNVHFAGDIPTKGDFDWVLRFYETDFTQYTGPGSYTNYFSRLSEVSILRLKFETDGVTYNLGVIDNKQTGSDKPVGTARPEDEDWWQKLMSAILLILLVVVLIFVSPVFKIFLSIFLSAAKILFSLFVAIISFPFKILKWIFGQKK